MYKEIKESTSALESKLVSKWKSENLLEKTIKNREGKEDFVFYDGPIYANAKPGLHHVFAKTIKDAFCKYQTMQGKRVLRKIGLDTHGLPIEVNVEKKLGFKTKADIEAFGIENFCKECNSETATNIDEVNKMTDMMGQLIDSDNPYITCTNEYIESEWWLIKNIFDKGLIYHGNKVLPYCYRCGTELSKNEVSLGYQEDTVNTVIVPFKLVDKDEYMLVWTTTPWTLIDNVAACVNPDLTYLKVESMGYKFILCESLANKVLGSEFTVLDKFKGSDMVGLKYEQLLPFAKVSGKSFVVLADNYVTDADGTGIVHIAPAYGEDDNRVCRENNIGFVQSVGKDGCYTTGPWKGTLVTDKDLEIEIIKWLKENDKLFKKIKLTHDYPHCWRCDTPLLYYPKESWFVAMTKLRDELVANNNKINWYPDTIRTGRFGKFLENVIDWGISRDRYWGTPLPVWKCECGHEECIGSIAELKEKAIDCPDEIELHKPYIDNVHLKCPECGKTMTRFKEVIDCWFDSGSMPFAQLHYPFENKEEFEKHFPAQFISEAIDQTRGWFYTLLAVSTCLFDKTPYENCIVLGHVLDEKGQKMSKSKGNGVDPMVLLDQVGADATRWHFYTCSAPWLPTRLGLNNVQETQRGFLSTLWNVYSFYVLYAEIDQFNPNKYADFKSENIMDKWILSKLNTLIKEVAEKLDKYDITSAALQIEDFTDELSNWYVRTNRERFWGEELTDDKIGAYTTLYKVLVSLIKISAPFVPFMTDEIYQNLVVGLDEKAPESVHLCLWPEVDEKAIDKKLENEMDLAYSLVKLGRSARNSANIKNRQPLSKMLISVDTLPEYYGNIVKEELNVKKVSFVTDTSLYMNFTVKPNFRNVGKVFGANLKEFQTKLLDLSLSDVKKLQNNESIKMNIAGQDYDIYSDMVDIRIDAKDGFDVGMDNNNFVILNTTLTKDLINEGIAREIISKVQTMRKNNNYELTDRINITYSADEDIKLAIDDFKDYIMHETLAKTIENGSANGEKFMIDDKEITIDISKN